MNKKFIDALLQSDREAARVIFKGELTENDSFHKVEDLVRMSLEQIGEDWEKGLISLMQVYMGGKICEELTKENLYVTTDPSMSHPPVAITILQDYHDLGKQMVISYFKSNGIDLIDFGSGISVDELIPKLKADKIEILLISALMLNTALKVKVLRKKMTEENIKTKIIVGGAPFRLEKDLWREVGADYCASTAGRGLEMVKELLK